MTKLDKVETAPAPAYAGFLAGVLSGITKNVVGHPFDTIKVRLQTAPPGMFAGPLDCLWQTFRREGVRGFYKGFTPPLVGWVAMDSVMLGSLHIYRGLVKRHLFPHDHNLPLLGHAIAGLGSGFTVSFVAAPVEQIKARLQVQYDAHTRLYTGPVDAAMKVFQKLGIRGIYLGLALTMIFRSNFVFWWTSYELFNRYFLKHTQLSPTAINFWLGGLLALVFWIMAYPADVVKQTIMTDNVDPAHKRFPRWFDAVKYIYRTRGLHGFTRGFIPCILRSFPANAAALAAFESTMRFLA